MLRGIKSIFYLIMNIMHCSLLSGLSGSGFLPLWRGYNWHILNPTDKAHIFLSTLLSWYFDNTHYIYHHVNVSWLTFNLNSVKPISHPIMQSMFPIVVFVNNGRKELMQSKLKLYFNLDILKTKNKKKKKELFIIGNKNPRPKSLCWDGMICYYSGCENIIRLTPNTSLLQAPNITAGGPARGYSCLQYLCIE